MIKRNPLIKTKSQTTRKKEVKELLSDVGMNFFDNKEWEQFEVWPMGDRQGEKSTYFTINRSPGDLEDALQTGLDMAKRLGKGKPKFLVQNPIARKCRTFQSKRKVGKRVIKVTRKVCRNPKDRKEIIKNLKKKYPFATLKQIDNAYQWALDTENDNSEESETWEDYFPECLKEIITDE